jgi:hypothetical protein
MKILTGTVECCTGTSYVLYIYLTLYKKLLDLNPFQMKDNICFSIRIKLFKYQPFFILIQTYIIYISYTRNVCYKAQIMSPYLKS